MNSIINKLVKDWAWRVNDGMPDPSKKNHLEFLEETLRSYKYPEGFISEFISQISEKRGKVYVKGKPPKGAKVQIGPRGGKYYYGDTKTGEPAKEPEPSKKEKPEPKKKDEPQSKLEKAVEKKKDQFIEKSNQKMDQIAFENEKDENTFKESLPKLIKGEDVSNEELEVINKYARIKDSEKETSIYIANSESGDFRQGRRAKIELGGSAAGLEIKKKMEAAGMEKADAVTSTSAAPVKIGGKKLTGGKLAAGPPRVEKVEVKKDDKGNVTSVSIGNHKMQKLPVPDKKQLAELSIKLEQLQKQNPDVPKDEIESQADRTVRAINRRNKMIDKYAENKEIAFVQTVEGADSATKEGREKICKEYPKQIAKKMEEAIGENPTKAEKGIIDRVNKLGDIENADEYEKESMAILADMNKIDSIRKGAADLTESMVYLSLNKKGMATELPAGETVKVSDIVTFSDDSEINPRDPNYLKQVASKGLEYVVTMEREGGVSVKMDGGAASGARAKMEITEFKNKDTKEKCISLVDNHNNFIGTKKEPTSDEGIEKGKKTLDETENWAKENGVVDNDWEPKIGKRTPRQWAEDQIKEWESKGKYKSISPEEKERKIKGLELAAHQGALIEEIHNRDIQEQPYGNINVKLGKGEGKMEVTDGITTASLMGYQANPGFSFIKLKSGEILPRPNAVYAGNLVHSEYNHETQRFEKSK